MRSWIFLLIALAVGAVVFFGARYLHNDYLFFAGYVVLEYLVLATAWNILGGYCGYVNFGTAAFFALGAYTSVAIHKFSPMPIPVLILTGGIVSGIVGLGMGYLTLRLRGAFFSIATLALGTTSAARAAPTWCGRRWRPWSAATSNICSWSCWCWRSSPCSPHG